MEDILEENTQLITSWMDKMTLKASITQMLTPETASCSAVFVQGAQAPMTRITIYAPSFLAEGVL